LGSSARARVAALSLGIAGALLLSLPARYYRVDTASCASWPSPSLSYLLSLAFLAAIALMALCWIGWWRDPPSLRATLLAGIGVHFCALLAPPFLSQDPLFYAALAKAMAKFHGSPYISLNQILPAGDPFLTMLPERWQAGTSAYFHGWNQLDHLVGLVAGSRLEVHFKLHQLIGMGSMVASAWLAAIATGEDPKHRARAAAMVIFCPLGVIEATQAAHNDALLAVATALFVLATMRRRPVLGLAALGSGLLVKASGALLLGMNSIQLLLGRIRLTTGRLIAAGLVLVAAAALAAPQAASILASFTQMLGSPTSTDLYCTRSVECIPRNILNTTGHYAAAWAVGLACRAAGALWLIYASVRGARDTRPEARLAWCALGFFIYFLYLHGWMQSWYLLPLLPLLPFADGRHLPAMATACVSTVTYYAIKLPTDCMTGPVAHGIGGSLESGIVLLPPTVALLWGRRATERR
jgi:hypothetical protein